jgi:hypothetical protein
MRAILWGSVAAGLLDLAFASVSSAIRGSGPVRMLQGIATGLLGADALRGGPASVLLGLVLFLVIIIGAASVFVLASRRIAVLVRHPVACGLAYGAAFNLFMSEVVVPLSAATRVAASGPQRLIPMVACALFVGLPIALATRRLAPPPERVRADEPRVSLASSRTAA